MCNNTIQRPYADWWPCLMIWYFGSSFIVKFMVAFFSVSCIFVVQVQLCALRAQAEYGDHGHANNFDYKSVFKLFITNELTFQSNYESHLSPRIWNALSLDKRFYGKLICHRRYDIVCFRHCRLIDLELTFSATPTHMMNIYGMFHWNLSTKYRDTASREIGVNGRGRKTRKHIASVALWTEA